MAFFDSFKNFLSSKKPLTSGTKSPFTLPKYGSEKTSPTPTNFTPANQTSVASYRDQFLNTQSPVPKPPVSTIAPPAPKQAIAPTQPLKATTSQVLNTPESMPVVPKPESPDFKSYYERFAGVPNLEEAESRVTATRKAEDTAFENLLSSKTNLIGESQKLFDSLFNAPEIKASREQRSQAFSQLKRLDSEEAQELEKFRSDSQTKGTPSWAYRRQQEIISNGFNAQRAGYATQYAIASDNIEEATKYAEQAYNHGLSILQAKIGLVQDTLNRASTLSEREKSDYETVLKRAKEVYDSRKKEQGDAIETYLSLSAKGVKGITPDMSIEQMSRLAGPEVVRQAQEERALGISKTRAEIGAAQALTSQRVAETKKTLAETGQITSGGSRTDEILGNLSIVTDILKSPGAISGPIQTGSIPFTGGAAIKNKYEQLKGILALDNRQKLKGSGAVSDFESRTLERASSALGRNLGEEEFSNELNRIKGVFQTAAGLQATVKITDPTTNQSSTIQANRAGINSALADGLTVEYQ